jgi:SpoVK/Ycf46/Vps4 family AAA+-type ATPase
MMLPTAAHAQSMRYRDPHCEALLKQLGKGAGFTQPVLLSFTGLPRIALAAAAREMAQRLGRPLLRAGLGAGTSPYIGETEKNLQVLFSRAESSGAVLLFDEADALFGKRTEVSSAHDRYANQEISYLLTRLQQFRGVAVVLFDSAQEAQRRRGRLQPVVVRFPAA